VYFRGLGGGVCGNNGMGEGGLENRKMEVEFHAFFLRARLQNSKFFSARAIIASGLF